MTQHTKFEQGSNGSSAPEHSMIPDQSGSEGEGASSNAPPGDDWDQEQPWQKARAAQSDPAAALLGLTPAEISLRHISMVNQLVEQIHPLASEYLSTALAVSPDAQGHDRLVGRACKLVGTTDQLIKTSARLTGGS